METITETHTETNLFIIRRLENKISELILLEGNMVWVRYRQLDDEVKLADAKQQTEAIAEINKGQPVHLILDFRDLDFSFSHEAKEYFAKSEAHSAVRMSQSLILSSLAHRLVGNVYLKLNRPNCPARIFADPLEAVKWVRGLV